MQLLNKGCGQSFSVTASCACLDLQLTWLSKEQSLRALSFLVCHLPHESKLVYFDVDSEMPRVIVYPYNNHERMQVPGGSFSLAQRLIPVWSLEVHFFQQIFHC